MPHHITYRILNPTEIQRIAEIDRAEEIFASYQYKNNSLILIEERISVTEFYQQELNNMLQHQQQILAAGGKVIAAFDTNNHILGAASIEKPRRGQNTEYCKLDILYVSKNARGKKIGQHLLNKCKIIAKKFGATKLYISSTPTKGTVDFYLNNGAIPAKEIDEELFKMEPKDIHLEIGLFFHQHNS